MRFAHDLVRLGRALVALLLVATAVSAQESDPVNFEAGVDAYRRGDHATARIVWRSLVDEDMEPEQRAALYYDLGNSNYRMGRLMESVAWYTSAVRTTPRDADAWRNLELVRREAGLSPADRGDLSSTVRRLLGLLDRTEAGWLSLGGLGVFFLTLAGEALRGGSLWRRLAFLGFLAALVTAAPLVWVEATSGEESYMVLDRPAAGLRSEPREDAAAVAQVPSGDEVEAIDELPGWVRVRNAEGDRGWVPVTSVQRVYTRP